MKYLKQFIIILLISFIGEFFKRVLPFPIPASIYGMVLLFAGLLTKIIPIDAVKDTGKLLIEIMPIMFIPAGVGLMTSYGILQPQLLPICVITVVAIVTVMVVTGHVSQFIINREKKGGKKDE